MQELVLRLVRTREQLWIEHGREPTINELAAALDCGAELVTEAVIAADGQHVRSLDAPTAEAGSSTHLELMGEPDRALVAVDDRLWAGELVKRLDVRAREVLRLRFELDLRQREIADRIGVSQMHVSRILRDALATLQRHATGSPPRKPHAAPA
jgi:RNA polymerase sigma-B factor